MIPTSYLQEWSAKAPWPDLRQVEQDLIVSRALCDLFTSAPLSGKLAFRGGTAINKVLFEKPLRYSEDIDLVHNQAGTDRLHNRCRSQRACLAGQLQA